METVLVFVGLLLSMLLFGSVVAFSPVLLTTELAVMTKSKNAVRNVFFLILGIATPIILLTLISLIYFDPNDTIDISLPSLSSVVKIAPTLDIFAGLVCIFYAIRLRFKSNDVKKVEVNKPKKSFTADKLDSPGVLYWFGFFKMALSLTSITAILLAIKYIKISLNVQALQAVLVIVLILASLAPFVFVAFINILKPTTFEKIQQASNTVTGWNYQIMIANLLYISGCILIIAGLIAY